MKNRKHKIKKEYLIVGGAVVLSVLIGALLSFIFSRRVERTVSEASYTPPSDNTTITRDGVTYKRDGSVRAYLFLGVDDVGLSYEDYGRGGRTDTIMLFAKDGSELRILEISRDTMTEVDTYDTAGDYLSTGVMQINMQYSFGNSPRRSAYLTKRAVSALLGGIEINGAVALDMSGIAPIVNALGGVDVRMEEARTYIDPAYTLGAVIHMGGGEAETFIRWRDKSSVGQNDARMSRDGWFMRQMLESIKGQDLSFYLDIADPYINTDLTADEINDLFECDLADTVRVPGESRRTSVHDEFYVDEDALQVILIDLFYRRSDRQ